MRRRGLRMTVWGYVALWIMATLAVVFAIDLAEAVLSHLVGVPTADFQ